MSATDSASLMDGPEASRLGVYRALLHDEREGVHELFRPLPACRRPRGSPKWRGSWRIGEETSWRRLDDRRVGVGVSDVSVDP